MSDFTSGFWSPYIAVLTILAIVGCGWLLHSQSVSKSKSAGTTEETTGHTWDGDLAEYNNPLPRWWRNLFWITIVFSIVYLVLYPGLGAFQGVLGWSQVREYREERAEVDARVAPLYQKYTGMEVAAVAADPQARAMGERIFLNQCAQCHGSDAGGAKGFPSLRDGDWLYGGEPKSIVETITNGRMGVMPAHGSSLSGDDVKNVLAYVRSLAPGYPADPLRVHFGRAKFTQLCAGCHGFNGKGNTALGAPNLADDIWLHGGSDAAVTESIVNGRNASGPSGTLAMPAFGDLLDASKIHVVAAYVWSLSNLRDGAR